MYMTEHCSVLPSIYSYQCAIFLYLFISFPFYSYYLGGGGGGGVGNSIPLFSNAGPVHNLFLLDQ